MELYLFQGTFNPIHNAHLRIAGYVQKHFNAEKIIFIPAFQPPHKCCRNISPEHRLNIVKLATEDNPKFCVSDIEYKLGGKSYTYRTICELSKKYENIKKISFIIGTDAFREIQSWYESEKLKNLVEFIVFTREPNFNLEELNHLNELGYKFTFMPLDFEDISSTGLRESVKNNYPVTNYVPEKVEEYIKKYDLYKN